MTEPGAGSSFTPAPVKRSVPLATLEALDIRLGTVTGVDNVADSQKLVALTVSFGDHVRRILAGVKRERSDPTELVGRQALFVINLEARRMAGTLSEGMLLDIGYADGLVPVLAVPERPLHDGARAG
jgi:tRNA-binding protein